MTCRNKRHLLKFNATKFGARLAMSATTTESLSWRPVLNRVIMTRTQSYAKISVTSDTV